METLIDRWVTEVYEKAKVVDPNDDYTWDGLALGFALGSGLSLDSATHFVSMLSSRGLV
jgi:hypothetical protein